MAAICHITNLPCSICSPFICTRSQRRGLAHMHGAHILLYVGKSKREKLALQFIFIPTYIRVTVWRGKWIWGKWKSPWCKSTDRSCTSLWGSTVVGDGVMPPVRSSASPDLLFLERNTTQSSRKVGRDPTVHPRYPRDYFGFHCVSLLFHLYTNEAEIHPLLKAISPLR